MNDDDDKPYIATRMPGRWVICSACNGHGKSSAYLGAFSREDMDNDPDFRDDYMAGNYDRPCESCRNMPGRVWKVDVEHLNPRQKALYDKEQERLGFEIECYNERKHESLMLGESSLSDWS